MGMMDRASVYKVNFFKHEDFTEFEHVVAFGFRTSATGDVVFFDALGEKVMYAAGTWMSVVRTDEEVTDYV